MSRREETVLLTGGIWLALLDLLLFFRDDLEDPFGFLALLLFPFCLIGVFLVLWSLGLLVTSKYKVLPALALMIPIGTLLHACFIGERWVDTVRFQLVRGRYQAIISRIQAAPASERSSVIEKVGGILTNHPLRIAFDERSSGSICTYVIYDPTGSVTGGKQRKDGGSNRDDPELARLRNIFVDEPLCSAESLGGPWYRCSYDLAQDVTNPRTGPYYTASRRGRSR